MRALSVLVLLLVSGVILVATSRTDPDPYWYSLAFKGIKPERDIPVPVDFVPDPNPEAVPIPAGAPTVTFGLVITDATGYENRDFSILHHQGLRMMQWRANSMGKLVLNDTVHYVDLKVLSGGPDCASFLIEYEYLITVVGVDFLFHPVNPNCTQLAFLAEAYSIPIINAPDFALTIYQQFPSLPFFSLRQLYSVAANYSLLAPSCLLPVMGKGAKTIAILHAGTIGQDVVPTVEGASTALGLTKALNNTYLDLDKQQAAVTTGDPCSYVRPYIQALKDAKPDVLVYSLGQTYTDEFTRCMRRESYYPPAYWPFASNTLPSTSESWMTSYSLINDMWLGGTNTTDPLMISVTNYTSDFVRLFGDSLIVQIAYVATSSTAGTIAIQALNMAGSTDPDAFNQAMHSVQITSLIGDTYMVPGTQIFYHPFFCRQLGNGPAANQSYVIFPFDTPNTQDVVYPAVVTVDPVFAASLVKHSWWTHSRKVGVGVGITMFVLIGVGAAALLYYLLVVKYHTIFIPKSVTGDEWAS